MSGTRSSRTDLTVAQSKLDQRRMYGALLVPAERAGFASAVDRRTVQVEAPAAAPSPAPGPSSGDEMRRGSQLVLTEAFAQGRRDSRGAGRMGPDRKLRILAWALGGLWLFLVGPGRAGPAGPARPLGCTRRC